MAIGAMLWVILTALMNRGARYSRGSHYWQKDETMQTDCRLLGGDSGGPLFNLKGQVIGIHSRISQLPDENFHIPTETFLSIGIFL